MHSLLAIYYMLGAGSQLQIHKAFVIFTKVNGFFVAEIKLTSYSEDFTNQISVAGGMYQKNNL